MLSVTVSLWFGCKVEEHGGSGDRENRGREGAEERAEGGSSKRVEKGGKIGLQLCNNA